MNEEERIKLDDIKLNLTLQTDQQLLKHIVDNWWVKHDAMSICNATTLKSWMEIWLENTKLNMPEIMRGKDIAELFPETKEYSGHAVIIGGGPSLGKDDFQQLKLLAKKYRGTIVCVDKSLKMALEDGVIPKYVTTLDANPIVATWFDHKIIRKNAHKTKFIVPTSSHPNTVKAITGEKYFFSAAIDDRMLPNVGYILSRLTGKTQMNPAFNTGAFSWVLCTELKIRDVAMIGMEHAYPPETKLIETQKFKSFVELAGGKIINKPDGTFDMEFPCSTCKVPMEDCKNGKLCLEQIYEAFFRGHNDFFNTDYLSDGNWAIMADSFKMLLKMAKENIKEKTGYDITLTNCTPTGILNGDGIEQDYLENWLRKHE